MNLHGTLETRVLVENVHFNLTRGHALCPWGAHFPRVEFNYS